MNEALNVATRHGASRVSAVRVRVGPLSGVVPALLQHAYPLTAAGTCAEGSELTIDKTAIRVRCGSCGAESDARPQRLLCQHCDSPRVTLLSGDELLLESVTLHGVRRFADIREGGHV